jgi:DNA-binding NarL/FixJ family response regulator
MIDVVLADDHQIVLQGLKAMLEAEHDMRVLAVVSDGLAVSDTVEQFKPDVLVLDLMMPGLNGLDVVRLVRQRSPKVRTIMLSMHSNEAYVVQALRNGASGYVLKDASAETLVDAIREVAAGNRFLSPPFSEISVEAYLQRSAGAAADAYDSLTAREREVMLLAAEGNSNHEIADKLSISPRTVEVHRARIMEKLNLKNHTHLVKYAVQRGLLVLES